MQAAAKSASSNATGADAVRAFAALGGICAVLIAVAPPVARADEPVPEAPVIQAPENAVRAMPFGSSGFLPEASGFNSFAGGDMPMPSFNDIAPPQMPVVVELFTSQGCSSCPPTDAMIAMLAGQSDVLPLSFHVDYWDYLGWADSFARPEFSARQEAYARAAGERSVYTPQLIVEGTDTALSLGPAQLTAMIDAHRMAPALVTVQRSKRQGGDFIEILPLSEIRQTLDVMLVRFAPERSVEVSGGENEGRRITYANVVLGLERLAQWDGQAPLRLNVRAGAGQGDDSFPADTRHAILVQIAGQPAGGAPGAILAAITLD